MTIPEKLARYPVVLRVTATKSALLQRQAGPAHVFQSLFHVMQPCEPDIRLKTALPAVQRHIGFARHAIAQMIQDRLVAAHDESLPSRTVQRHVRVLAVRYAHGHAKDEPGTCRRVVITTKEIRDRHKGRPFHPAAKIVIRI